MFVFNLIFISVTLLLPFSTLHSIRNRYIGICAIGEARAEIFLSVYFLRGYCDSIAIHTLNTHLVIAV